MTTRSRYLSAERLVQRITLAAIVLCIALIVIKGVAIDFVAYAKALAISAVLISIGLWYRHSGRDERIGTTTISAGWFILFTLSLSLFNYLLMPHWVPTFDPYLVALDFRLFSYSWPDFVEWNTGNPMLYEAMRYAYLSTLPQVAILLIALGLSGRMRTMYTLMTTITVSGTAAVVIWGCFPSLGPSAIYNLSPELLVSSPPVVDPSYGQEIARLYREGATFLSPNEIRGLIAFPSFHIVLALAATYYSRELIWLFIPFLAINILVIPSVLVHGGHHVVDIPAGLLVFIVAAFLSRQVILRDDQERDCLHSAVISNDTPGPA